MQAKITKSLIDAAIPSTREYSIVDTTQPGLELRVRTSGRKTWIFRFQIDGGPQQRFKLGYFPGVSVADARVLALIAAGDVAKGVDIRKRQKDARLVSERARSNTLRKLIETRYTPWAKSNLSSWQFCVDRLESDFADFLDNCLTSFDVAFAEAWRSKRKDKGNQNITINRKLQRLHALLNKAVEWEIIDRHPFAGLKPLKTDKTGRCRFLDDEEEPALRAALVARETEHRAERERYIEHCRIRGMRLLPRREHEYTDHLRPITLVAMNTGLRRKELFELKWRHVNLITRLLTVEGITSKNKQTRRIPLNSEAFQVLTAWKRQCRDTSAEAYVFPGKKGGRLTTITTAWRSVRAAAGLRDFRFHDLRHHFASMLAQAGVDLNTIRALLGHADIKMVLRYAHLAPNGLAVAVEKVCRISPAIADAA